MVCRNGKLARLCAIVVAAIALSACAMQPKTVAEVGVGNAARVPQEARPFAQQYMHYAMMASLAYTDKEHLNPAKCPDYQALNNAAWAGAYKPRDKKLVENAPTFWKHLADAGWRCAFGELDCLDNAFPHCLPGLEYHAWKRKTAGCTEVVIAFRGTDTDDAGDWITNFRWFVGFFPFHDQYDQVNRNIGRIIEKAQAGCGKSAPMVATVGHSLGGGLAQHAAYADKRVRFAYAFDSSPVTGILDVVARVRAENLQRLGIDRVHEAGEILAIVRAVTGLIVPSSACDPRVRVVRFNILGSGSLFAQHSIVEQTNGFIKLAGSAPHRRQSPVKRPEPADGRGLAASCATATRVAFAAQ